MSIVTNQVLDLDDDRLEAGGFDPTRATARRFFGGWADEKRERDGVLAEWGSPRGRPTVMGSVSEEEMDEDVDLSS